MARWAAQHDTARVWHEWARLATRAVPYRHAVPSRGPGTAVDAPNRAMSARLTRLAPACHADMKVHLGP